MGKLITDLSSVTTVAHLGGEAPAHLPRWLSMRELAYRLQSDAFGDLDKSIRRILRSGKDDGVGAPFRAAFLAAYDNAHPGRREVGEPPAGVRLISLVVPDLGNARRNQAIDALIAEYARHLVRVATLLKD